MQIILIWGGLHSLFQFGGLQNLFQNLGEGGVTYFNLGGGGVVTYFNLEGEGAIKKKISTVTTPIFSGIALIAFYT